MSDDAPYWHVPARRRLEHVRAFCENVSSGEEPVPVQSRPRIAGLPNECFGNVAKHVARFGGGILHGWVIWEIPRTMIEAEFHAVWRDPAGSLVDVNPRRKYETRITFLPAPTMEYLGTPVNNIRRPLVDDPRVDSFIDYANRRYELLKPYPPGEVHLSVEVIRREFPNIGAVEKAFGFLAIERRDLADPCLCGQPRRFGDCHAAEFGR